MIGGCHSKITAVALAEVPTRRDRRSLAWMEHGAWLVVWRTVTAHGHEEAVYLGTDCSRMGVGKGDGSISRSTGSLPGLMAG